MWRRGAWDGGWREGRVWRKKRRRRRRRKKKKRKWNQTRKLKVKRTEDSCKSREKAEIDKKSRDRADIIE